jgi:glycosyltransferase involved in cell wall biosynthesis
MQPLPVSVCILTLNAEATLLSTLESARLFQEVLLLDQGSVDSTLSLAHRFPNVIVHQSSFIGFGALRNRAASLARYPWILALDSDEVVSFALYEEIQKTPLNLKFVYGMRRKNFLYGKWVKGCGWHPDWVKRLYHRDEHAYKELQVHESLLHQRPFIPLEGYLLHTPYRSVDAFRSKRSQYAMLFAKEYRDQKKVSLGWALCKSLFAWSRAFFLQKGFLLGRRGWIVSLHQARSTWDKYDQLRQIQRNIHIHK